MLLSSKHACEEQHEGSVYVRIWGFVKQIIGDILSTLDAVRADESMYMKLDPALEKRWMLWISSVGFHALIAHRFSHLLWRWKLKFPALLVYTVVRVITSIDIHPAAGIEPGVVIDHGVGTVIGSTATVGSGTLIYHGVTLGSRLPMKGKRHPDVGRNVILGAGAKILGPIKVGDGAKVGANAVVLEDVPPRTTIAGIPAKVMKEAHSKLEPEVFIRRRIGSW